MSTSAPTVVRVPSYHLRMYLVRSVDTENPPHVGRMASPIRRHSRRHGQR